VKVIWVYHILVVDKAKILPCNKILSFFRKIFAQKVINYQFLSYDIESDKKKRAFIGFVY